MVLADAARLAILLHDSHNFDFFVFAAADNEAVAAVIAAAVAVAGADVLDAVFGPPIVPVDVADARRTLAFSAALPPSAELGERDC